MNGPRAKVVKAVYLSACPKGQPGGPSSFPGESLCPWELSSFEYADGRDHVLSQEDCSCDFF